MTATYCINCGKFITDDGVETYLPDIHFKEKFEVKNEICTDCLTENILTIHYE